MAVVEDLLLQTGRYFTRDASEDLHAVYKVGGREGDVFYRDRWSHDTVVRSTHGVNCTGSCSWKVYVKDGIITWETQQTDYPSVGPDKPEYEPRGCPRGAAFSWYTYSPTRVRYPYVRGVLLEAYLTARKTADPVQAWASIKSDYKKARGKGGLVRTDWQTAIEIVAAAHVHTIKKYGPDRIAGFSPIPAMSMASHAAGARFISLIGGAMLSFYDWYADLPVASPQVFGDQTDVPESADWWDAAYLMMWGSNVPVTRTPDAHWMAEARYRGQKVVVVSPDYADNVKFADEWMPARPGTDGALAMAMGHVLLKHHLINEDYLKKYTDAPFLVTIVDGQPSKFLTAKDLGDAGEGSAFKTVLWDSKTDTAVVPNGSLGFRWAETGFGKWNLDLQGVDPDLHAGPDMTRVKLPHFREDHGVSETTIQTRQVGPHTVTTVFELLKAQYQDYTPDWAQGVTGVNANQIERVAKEFGRTALKSGGRCMILMGAGTNHWFHSDTIYRGFLALLTLTGCQGRNGGGWGHYVGQEKCRPVTGWATIASASDWSRPPRHMAGTPYWYLNTSQWRYDSTSVSQLRSPLSKQDTRHTADLIALSARLGWMPSYPTFNRNPLELGEQGIDITLESIKDGTLKFAAEDPDAPENWPRVLTVWRANLLGSSAKGNEYFLKHLLGTDSNLRATPAEPGHRPRDVAWRETAPEGKLDLLVALDFRMTSTTMFADVVLPAATWYEKHDLSSTDMHPFVHAFTPAIPPPWQTRTDFAIFHDIAEKFSELGARHLGVKQDLVATPLLHDSPAEMAQPGGHERDWRTGAPAIPGKTMPLLTVVERDYGAIADKMKSLGPLPDKLGVTTKGITYHVGQEIAELKRRNGEVNGRPSLATDIAVCETILALSGTTNGRLALQGFETLEKRTGTDLRHLALENEGKRIVFADTQARPTAVVTSPEWSGSETGGRRYSAFTINVEHDKPWHTLTGRQHFFLDHDWMHEYGETLPTYRPPLTMARLETGPGELQVRYLTPHSKWSIHSEYQDNLFMLTLSRGGQSIWMSKEDAEKLGIEDNDWIEALNPNGVVAARAIVSHKMPPGTVYMYHAQDRLVGVPKTETTGKRGGIHNSLTRLLIKPTHLIGGYAQLSFAFNYLGPTGNQRDEVTIIRKRQQEVTY